MSMVLPISIVLGLVVAGFFMSINSPPWLTMVAGGCTLAGAWWVLEDYFRNKENKQ